MTQHVSKTIADHRKIVNTLVSALEVHGPQIFPALEKRLFPKGVPQNLSVAQVIGAVVGVANEAVTQMEAADQKHATELSDDPHYRSQRQSAVATLREYLSAARSAMEHGYTPVVAAAYNLNLALPDDVPTLFSRASSVLELLKTRPLSEAPKMASMTINPALLAGELESALQAALQADKDVERERKEAELTVNAKRAAIEQWPSSYPPAADILAAVCVLSGLPGLGDKVRPTSRRRSGLPEAEDEGQAAENAAQAGGSANG